MVRAVSAVAIRHASKPMKSNLTPASFNASSSPDRLMEPEEANFSS